MWCQNWILHGRKEVSGGVYQKIFTVFDDTISQGYPAQCFGLKTPGDYLARPTSDITDMDKELSYNYVMFLSMPYPPTAF